MHSYWEGMGAPVLPEGGGHYDQSSQYWRVMKVVSQLKQELEDKKAKEGKPDGGQES
jgi:hypothetical protein